MSFDNHKPAGWPYTLVSAVDIEDVDVSVTDVTLPRVARALWIGTTGNVEVTTLGGSRVVIPNAPVGRLDVMVTKVWNANTTASDIQAWY